MAKLWGLKLLIKLLRREKKVEFKTLRKLGKMKPNPGLEIWIEFSRASKHWLLQAEETAD